MDTRDGPGGGEGVLDWLDPALGGAEARVADDDG
jgi:hypothetical protein